MLPQFDRDVFDISPDKIAKVDNLHIPDLPMLHFPQNLTQNKKYSYHVTYHVTPKSFDQFLQYKKASLPLSTTYICIMPPPLANHLQVKSNMQDIKDYSKDTLSANRLI